MTSFPRTVLCILLLLVSGPAAQAKIEYANTPLTLADGLTPQVYGVATDDSGNIYFVENGGIWWKRRGSRKTCSGFKATAFLSLMWPAGMNKTGGKTGGWKSS